MLLYLDNHLSVGPSSRAAKVVKRRQKDRQLGLNENLAREILELHTLGVERRLHAGGCHHLCGRDHRLVDRRQLRAPEARRCPASSRSVPEVHEPGAKTVLGKRYGKTARMQGDAVLRDLATHPATATLHRDQARASFHRGRAAGERRRAHREGLSGSSRGDLRTTIAPCIAALVEASGSQPLAKFKTPSDYIVSSIARLRSAGRTNGAARSLSFELLGQRTYSPGSPAGWPDRSLDWDGSSALMKRIEWADAVGQRVGNRQNARNSRRSCSAPIADGRDAHRDRARRERLAGAHAAAHGPRVPATVDRETHMATLDRRTFLTRAHSLPAARC